MVATTWSLESATRALRGNSPAILVDGLSAYLSATRRQVIDPRDFTVGLAPFYDCAERIGLDPVAVFDDVAAAEDNDVATAPLLDEATSCRAPSASSSRKPPTVRVTGGQTAATVREAKQRSPETCGVITEHEARACAEQYLGPLPSDHAIVVRQVPNGGAMYRPDQIASRHPSRIIRCRSSRRPPLSAISAPGGLELWSQTARSGSRLVIRVRSGPGPPTACGRARVRAQTSTLGRGAQLARLTTPRARSGRSGRRRR